MSITQARFIQANPHLFSGAKRLEADVVAGVFKPLHTIFKSIKAPAVPQR